MSTLSNISTQVQLGPQIGPAVCICVPIVKGMVVSSIYSAMSLGISVMILTPSFGIVCVLCPIFQLKYSWVHTFPWTNMSIFFNIQHKCSWVLSLYVDLAPTIIPHKVKTKYVQIENKVDTSIKYHISGQSTFMLKGYMYICLI